MIYSVFHRFFRRKKPCLDVKLNWINMTETS
jgi:hypothetical protein